MSVLNEIKESIIVGDAKCTEQFTHKAIDIGVDMDNIINNGFIAAMADVGEKFKNNEIFVPEMLIAARAMKYGLSVLEPLIMVGERKYLGRIAIGTVQGDLHDIGKNLVGMMLQGSGYEVVDLGVDVKAAQFVHVIQEQKPQVVGLSSLLTTTMPFMKKTIEAIEHAGFRKQVKVLIGGAPVSQSFADEIGADGYAADAGSAVELVRKVLE